MTSKGKIILVATFVALVALAWRQYGLGSAVCLAFVGVGIAFFDRIYGEIKTNSFIAGLVAFFIAFVILDSVFSDMLTTLKISFGFFVLKISLDFFFEAFESPIRVGFRFRGKKIARADNDKDI